MTNKTIFIIVLIFAFVNLSGNGFPQALELRNLHKLTDKPAVAHSKSMAKSFQDDANKKAGMKNKLTVKIRSGNIRKTPSLEGSVKFRLLRGMVVSVVKTTGEWNFIEDENGRRGWGHQSIFSKSSKIVTPLSKNNLMSLNFREIDIRELISALAMKRKKNIVMSNDVSGKISVHIYQVSLDEALSAITLAGGFDFQKHGETYYIYKPKIMKDPQQDSLKMWVYKLKYVDTKKVKKILGFPGMRPIKIYGPSKTVIVEDTPENIKKIKTLVRYLDVSPKQVLIEAKILEVTLTDDMSMGVNWEQILHDVRIGTGGLSTANLPGIQSISPVPGTGTGMFANMITGAGTSHQFTAALDALRTKTKVNTLSTPKILAIHGKKARVQVGGQQGYKVTTVNQGVATENINFIDTGTILEITPFINDEGNVLLNVKPSINSATIEAGVPVVKTTDVSTWLLAKDGQTVFIGGLIRDTRTQTREMIPCLGSVPGFGLLFGRSLHNIGKSELVVMITPKIIKEDGSKNIEKIQNRIMDMEGEIKKDLKHPYKKFLKE